MFDGEVNGHILTAAGYYDAATAAWDAFDHRLGRKLEGDPDTAWTDPDTRTAAAAAVYRAHDHERHAQIELEAALRLLGYDVAALKSGLEPGAVLLNEVVESFKQNALNVGGHGAEWFLPDPVRETWVAPQGYYRQPYCYTTTRLAQMQTVPFCAACAGSGHGLAGCAVNNAETMRNASRDIAAQLRRRLPAFPPKARLHVESAAACYAHIVDLLEPATWPFYRDILNDEAAQRERAERVLVPPSRKSGHRGGRAGARRRRHARAGRIPALNPTVWKIHTGRRPLSPQPGDRQRATPLHASPATIRTGRSHRPTPLIPDPARSLET